MSLNPPCHHHKYWAATHLFAIGDPAVKRILYLIFAFLSFAAAAHAGGDFPKDVVTLKNGDRVTGTFVNEKAGKLQLKSDVLGDLSIPMDKIASFAAEKSVRS